MKNYIELLNNPSKDSRGFTRWWWYGCAVEREEIKRELKYMKEANIGGVEIQILYPISADNKKFKVKNIPYFSKEFFDILEFTVNTAKELDLIVDFTFGSSWPFGGPFIPHSMAPQSAIPYQIDVSGPCNFNYDFTTRVNGEIVKIIFGKMQKGKMIEESILDITKSLKKRELYGWPWGDYIENLAIPEGDYKIVAFVINGYRQTLGAPSLNAGGYVIDHCRSDVSDFFFKNAGKPLIDRLGRGKINSFFCDSIELSGNNWTSILFEEFEKRRGYKLDKYIYALWGEIDDVSQNVRYDYFKTMSELTIENFFENMTKWCRDNGSTSRIQAHGTWADILKAYASADIPEGETFGQHDRLEVNSIHRRFATSAAHLYGKNIVSNESFTWLRVPRFLETLENMKASVDAIFLDGINMIVNHGYAYSSESSGKLGWTFYASSHICHKNTYWPYYKELGAYIQRVSEFMRLGRHKCDVAIYLPQADVWSENPMCDLHMGMKLQEYLGWETADRINKAGYYFDYINDDAINNIGEINKGIKINNNNYKMIVLIGCKRLQVETASSLKRFVENGGILIAAENIPDRSCGMINKDYNDDFVKVTMLNIFSNLNKYNTWGKYGEGYAAVASDRNDELINTMKNILKPDAEIKNNNDTVGYIHRIDKGNDIYFMSNISEEYKDTIVEFSVSNKGFRIFDALTCREVSALSYNAIENGTQIKIRFEPYESVIIVFSDSIDIKDLKLYKEHRIVKKTDISKEWFLEVPEVNYSRELKYIDFWQKFDELKYYSGEGYYTKEFDINIEDDFQDIILKLQKVKEIAEIYINGRYCGVIWKKPNEISIKEYLVNGKNTISIKAVNRLINYAINPENEEKLYDGEVMEEWPYFTETINHIIKRRLFNYREREAVKEPQPSGISGKIEIELVK